MAGKIIFLNDIYEMRERKEKELAFYHEQLKKLNEKLFFVQKEIDLTNYIIDIIEHEKVIDIKNYIEEKKK